MSDRLNQLKLMLDQDPNDSFITYAIAKEYEKLDQLKNALDTYISLMNNDPEYVGLYYHLGQLYEQLDENDKAMEIYESGILIAKKQSDFHALSELNGVKTNLEMDL